MGNELVLFDISKVCAPSGLLASLEGPCAFRVSQTGLFALSGWDSWVGDQTGLNAQVFSLFQGELISGLQKRLVGMLE